MFADVLALVLRVYVVVTKFCMWRVHAPNSSRPQHENRFIYHTFTSEAHSWLNCFLVYALAVIPSDGFLCFSVMRRNNYLHSSGGECLRAEALSEAYCKSKHTEETVRRK